MNGQLTEFQAVILDELCQSKITRSAVVLAEALYERGYLRQRVDPYGITEWALKDLNDAGFVTYRLGYGSVPTEIRVSREGYKRAGYPVQVAPVGARARHGATDDDGARKRPGDITDFRNLMDTTFGGAIERCHITEHLERYPDHDRLHMEQLREMRMTAPLTQERIESIVRYLHGDPKATNQAVADRFSVSNETVRQIRQANEEARTGVRFRVLQYIVQHGPLDSIKEIEEKAVGAGFHEGTHVIFRLKRAGLVTAREEKRGRATLLRKIEATRLGREAVMPDDPVMLRVRPIGVPGGVDRIDAAIATSEGRAFVIQPEVPAMALGETQEQQNRIAAKVPTAVVPRPGDRPLVDPNEREEAWYNKGWKAGFDIAKIDLPMYPLVEAIVQKYRNREKVREAAAILEAAGLVDIAAMALEEGGEPTDLEKEILDIVDIATGGKE